MVRRERVQEAVVRLDQTHDGRMAKEEAESGMDFIEIIASYDLTAQEVEDIRAILEYRRRRE